MGRSEIFWPNARDYLVAQQPEHPVLFFSSQKLHDQATHFIQNFPGQVTYAVKANPGTEVLANLMAAGITGFDVASAAEILAVRSMMPDAELHYNNPVRSRHEIAIAAQNNVQSYSVESHSELAKLAEMVHPAGVEIAVRFKLPVGGASYDFGSKFGAQPSMAADLLAKVKALGFAPSLTFHPGTQCLDPDAWVQYIQAAADICDAAGVRIGRLNVGGGFPSHRTGAAPSHDAIFRAIQAATTNAFGADCPKLICEPGRAMVAEAYALGIRIKAVRDQRDVFLNDGIYGALAELPLLGLMSRIHVMSDEGKARTAPWVEWPVFGPTCDSVDKLPDGVTLPQDILEGDYLIIEGMGAYSTVTNTRFNGYGDYQIVDTAAFV